MKVKFRHIASTACFPMLLAAVLVFAACSGSDHLEPSEPSGPEVKDLMPISFAGGMQEEQAVTRAGLEEVLTGDKTFQVWGYKNDAYSGGSYTSYQAVMPNFTVKWSANTAYTTTSNTNDWEYVGQGSTPEQQAEQTIKYWDFAANAYRFFGYALGNATADPATSPAVVTVPGGFPTGNSTSSSAEAVTFSAAVDASSNATIAAAPYFSHLWFSDGNAATYPDRQFGQPVVLQFLKPFARVRFLFTFVEGLNFGREKLGHIGFGPSENFDNGDANDVLINTAGTVSVTYPLKGTATTETWATTNATGIKQFDIDFYEVPVSTPQGYPVNSQPTSWPNTPEMWYTVLPNTTQSSFTARVSVVSDEIKTVVIPAEYMQWKAGFEYTYKFKITETGGITIDVVQVAINDWGNKRFSDHSVFNW
ncbi:MAG: fimbrillin family protein [Bacteroidaceae bacterium]|nr:fimbrillin family protein [Bacteroidaceae bacterium]